MLLWRCDLCSRLIENMRPWRALVWPTGINFRRNGHSYQKQPTVKCDLCSLCVEALHRRGMRRRGSNVGNRGSHPLCVFCAMPSKAVVRIIPNSSESWHGYLYTGTVCEQHTRLFTRNGRGTREYGIRRQELAAIQDAIRQVAATNGD